MCVCVCWQPHHQLDFILMRERGYEFSCMHLTRPYFSLLNFQHICLLISYDVSEMKNESNFSEAPIPSSTIYVNWKCALNISTIWNASVLEFKKLLLQLNRAHFRLFYI